jgi:membrane protease subunit HflK
VSDARKFLFNAADVTKNIHDISISVMRRVVGDKAVSDVLTKDRVLIAESALALTQETLDRFDMGVKLTRVYLQNVTPPDAVKPAFNEVNIAKQEREQLVNQAKANYNRVLPEAEGNAARLVSEAQAFAVEAVNRAKGDSEKLRVMLAAYHAAPQIAKKRMYIQTVEKIVGAAEHLTIVDSSLKGVALYPDARNGVQLPPLPPPAESAHAQASAPAPQVRRK